MGVSGEVNIDRGTAWLYGAAMVSLRERGGIFLSLG
jgi:hypothetical protein